MSKKKYKKMSITRMLCEESRPFFSRYENNVTRSAFVKNYRKFIEFCRSEHDCKTSEDCKNHIDDYVQFLISKELTANTIHTYMSPVALFFNIPLSDIEKPKRCSAHNVRSRSTNGKVQRSDNDPDSPKFAHLVEFQKRVGIRRRELQNLRGSDFKEDGNGNFYAYVRKGKGGKSQWQLILPEDVEFVKTYFDGTENKVFDSEEFKNKLDLHKLRAEQAKRAYHYYLDRINNEEGYREELEKLICKHWNERNLDKRTKKPKPINKKDLNGTYKLRGENKKLAQKYGLPTSYDRLCVLATSILQLSHWRLGVAINNYFLNI